MENCTYENLLSTMKKEYENLAGYRPSDVSDIGIRMRVLAKELEKLWLAEKECEKQVFPTTADAKYLDMHSELRGIKRKQGSKALGYVTFYRENSAVASILIPKGTVVSTSGITPIRFITCEDEEIKIGEKEVDIQASCDSIGCVGNVAAKTIAVVVTPVSGITGVTNRKMFRSGTEKETDCQLRKRLLNNYKKIDNGTNASFYYHKVMEYEGITSANVIPRANGVGTVEIIVDSFNTSVASKLLNQIKEEIGYLKEINVEITVKEAVKRYMDFKIELAVASGYSFMEAKEQCERALNEYFMELGVAEPVFLSALIAKIMSKKQISNCKIIAPQNDERPTSYQILRMGSSEIKEMAVV